jgi:hypothetical protein
MAKKRKGKIKILLSKPDNSNVVQLSDHGLPSYQHFIDAPDHSFRLFFEKPKSLSETKDPERPNKKFIRKPSGHHPFRIMIEGKKLIGEDIARTFAVLLSKRILNNGISNKKSPCCKEHNTINSFFKYLSTLSERPTLFSEINTEHLSGWLSHIPRSTSGTYKLAMNQLISLHPSASELDMSLIMRSHPLPNTKRLDNIDFDKIVQTKDYSERVHFQILAYVYFEIENAKTRLQTLEQASPDMLENEYVSSDMFNTKNPIVRLLLESGVEGFKKLKYHLFFYLEHPSSVKLRKTKPSCERAGVFVKRIREICSTLYKDSEEPYKNYDKFKAYLDSSEKNNWALNQDKVPSIYPYLNLTSKHHEIAIFIYALITLGVNKEVLSSWKLQVNGIPWYENYDVELGISKNSASRDKKVVLIGVKLKGITSRVVKKSISINSPLFKYLKFLDKTRPADREYIFPKIINISAYLSAFTRHYTVIDDDGNRLKTLETRRFRKSYIGYKTISLLEGVKNSDDLVLKLKDALNHKSFDTTFSSYIMKSGMAMTVVDSAIVALTTNMLENSMSFNGEIKEDNERSKNNDTVFLCDCSDPTNPSHGLPINNKCFKYDMCLGCERSEVYSEHLPAICYRILQYEKKQEEAPDIFKITLEDRLYIAKDTVEQFKLKHSQGMEIVEQSYLIANQAMLDDDPLLPPILQTGVQ